MEMTYVYVLVGILIGVIVFFYVVYQVIASLLLSAGSKPIADDQKEVCKKALAEGKAGSPYCRVYIQKGECGSKSCDVIK